MTNPQSLVPRITKMAKYLQALSANKDRLKATHHRILHILREMNTTVQIIAALTGIKETKVRSAVNDLHDWGLASIVEIRKGGARARRIWGMHDEFRAVRKVPTFPSVTQEASMSVASKKAGRKLEMDEVAAALWGEAKTDYKGHSATLVDIATGLKKTPIPNRELGDREARREAAIEAYGNEFNTSWALEDFAGDEEE